MPRHKNDTLDFDQLDHMQRTRSLNATRLQMARGLHRHFEMAAAEGRNVNEIRATYVENLRRLAEDVEQGRY